MTNNKLARTLVLGDKVIFEDGTEHEVFSVRRKIIHNMVDKRGVLVEFDTFPLGESRVYLWIETVEVRP